MKYKNFLLLLSAIGSAEVSAYRLKESQSFESIYDRTKPASVVDVDGEYQQESLIVEKVLEPGQKVYETYCATCHSIGLAGAPKTGDEDAWRKRMQTEWSVVVEHMVNGYKNMPAMGTCLDCSTEDLEDSLRYILFNSNIDDYKK